MKEANPIIEKVSRIYDWLDSQTRQYSYPDSGCLLCGNCCDFEKFDHRLFLTSPELAFFVAGLGLQNIKPMTKGVCPYNVEGKCAVYNHRFAGCRIFCCRADKDLQSELSESVLEKFKSICEELQILYRYTDLASALNSVACP